MIYALVFMVWALMMISYLATAARLIPIESRVAYGLSPVDVWYFAANALWWLVPLSWLATPSIPRGANWSMGALLFAGGAALVVWARRVNPFFLPVVQKPGRLVTAGPYKRLRHPGYVGFVAMALGSLLTLGHMTGLFPLVCYAALLAARARRENRILYSRN